MIAERGDGIYEYTGESREGWDCEHNPEMGMWRRTKKEIGHPCPHSWSCEFCMIMEEQAQK